MSILNKTKCTIIGPMQYSSGREIRQFFHEELIKLGITVFDHYNKPFFQYPAEDENFKANMNKLMEEGKYDEMASFRYIRSFDLALIDKSDFIIFHYPPNALTVGSWEEFFTANSCKKPIFFISEAGKAKTPFWVMWTIPHQYIVSTKEEVLTILKDIDSGQVPIDNTRWRLLDMKYR
jgi:hypothetical protein